MLTIATVMGGAIGAAGTDGVDLVWADRPSDARDAVVEQGELLWQRIGAGVRRGAYRSARTDNFLVGSSVTGTIVVLGTGRQPGKPGDRTLLQLSRALADGVATSRHRPDGEPV